MVLGLVLAIIVNQNVRGISIWRTVYYLPAIVSTVAYAQLWRFLLNRDYGLINNFLGSVGINRAELVLASLDHTRIYPAQRLDVGRLDDFNLAGLQSIPTELYDAAKVDGADSLQLLRHVTLPMMTPVIFYNLIMGIIAAMQSFTTFFIITSDPGNWMTPSEIGMVYMVYLYKVAFYLFQMGYGSALAWVMFIIILVLTIIVFKSSKSWVY